MSSFSFDLDTKSFFFNIGNDIGSGHSPTVATALKQGNTTQPALKKFQENASNITLNCPTMIEECTKNSKSVVRINNILVFNNIYLNGKKIETESEFCLYLKEEIDPKRVQFGRIKLHYPISFTYHDFQYSINNREIIQKISEELHNYAFLVSKIELFDEPGKINFITALIGERGIPYSKVFLNYKGNAAKKFNQVFNEMADNYEIETPKMRELGIPGLDYIDPSTYSFAYNYCKSAAVNAFLASLNGRKNISEVQNHTGVFPYDICDVEMNEDGEKRYFIIFFTTTNQDYFYLSIAKSNFLYNFQDSASVILVRDVLSSNPKIDKYDWCDLNMMRKDLEIIKYSRL